MAGISTDLLDIKSCERGLKMCTEYSLYLEVTLDKSGGFESTRSVLTSWHRWHIEPCKQNPGRFPIFSLFLASDANAEQHGLLYQSVNVMIIALYPCGRKLRRKPVNITDFIHVSHLVDQLSKQTVLSSLLIGRELVNIRKTWQVKCRELFRYPYNEYDLHGFTHRFSTTQ